MSVKQVQKKEFVVHDFDAGFDHTIKAIEKELSTMKLFEDTLVVSKEL